MEEKYKSRVIEKTLDPVWNEVFVVKVQSGSESTLGIEIELWDWDRVGNDYLGTVRLTADKFPSGEPTEFKLDVEGKEPGTKGK